MRRDGSARTPLVPDRPDDNGSLRVKVSIRDPAAGFRIAREIATRLNKVVTVISENGDEVRIEPAETARLH